MIFFVLNWLGLKKTFELVKHRKYFFPSNSLWYSKFRAFTKFHFIYYYIIFTKFHFIYYLYMLNFIPPIISIQTISFHILSRNTKFLLKSNTNSAYPQYALNFIPRTILSVYAKIHSAHSYYMLNFIPSIISIRTISHSLNYQHTYYQYALYFILCIISNFILRIISIR